MELHGGQRVAGKRAPVRSRARDDVEALGGEAAELGAVRLRVELVVHEAVVGIRQAVEIVQRLALVRKSQRAQARRRLGVALERDYLAAGQRRPRFAERFLAPEHALELLRAHAAAELRQADLGLADEHVVEIEIADRAHRLGRRMNAPGHERGGQAGPAADIPREAHELLHFEVVDGEEPDAEHIRLERPDLIAELIERAPQVATVRHQPLGGSTARTSWPCAQHGAKQHQRSGGIPPLLIRSSWTMPSS